MNFSDARQAVISAFDSNFCYSNELPPRINDFIDGMAWVGLLCGASYIANDVELIQKSESYLKILLDVGKNARNFAVCKINDEWKKSSVDRYWYLQKPQSFAGPAGLEFAIKNGAKLKSSFNIKEDAEFYANWSNMYGYILRIPFLGKLMEQHINSVMLGCLIAEKKPGKSLKWLYESNPFYAYIAGQKMDVEYPPDTKHNNYKIIRHKDVQPISKRKPSSWVWKQHPKNEYVPDGDPNKRYTPTAYMVACYLQNSI